VRINPAPFGFYIWHFVQDHANWSSQTCKHADFGSGGCGLGARIGIVLQQMALHLQKTVVLVGMMGAGKTAVGGALARRLAVPFLDCDDEIVKAARLSIAEIFERDGEPFFRQKETQVLRRLLSGPTCVLSTGGGAFISAENRAMIAHYGVSLWLDADLDLLWQRVRQKANRPLLRTENPYETLRKLLDQRRPCYEMASLRVQAQTQFSVEDTAQAVIDRLMAAGLVEPDETDGAAGQ